MRKIIFVTILLLSSGCAAHTGQLRYFSAPTVLPDVGTAMKTPGFWVSRIGSPDEPVMSAAQIQEFNRRLIKAKLRDDIADYPATFSGRPVKNALDEQLKRTASRGLFLESGEKAGSDFFTGISQNMRLEDIPDNLAVKFALVCSNSEQRVLPTGRTLTEKPLDIDFDELQNNSLDINTPVAVLWQTKDSAWSYAVGPSSMGWLKSENLAWCGKADIGKMYTGDFIVVTEAKADIYLDKEMKNFYGFVRMGARFPVKDYSESLTEIVLPVRDEKGGLRQVSGYMRSKDIHRGYLPYTPRAIIEQAFEMLNTPYGWGGANGEQDCSQFLQEIFATVGLDIPRNSSLQAKAGILLCAFADEDDRSVRLQKVLAKCRPGLSLMYMQGHIMLYLGQVDGVPYAIHDTWAYRQRIGQKDTPILINRVTVSGLDLGQGSTKGSLLNRLKSIRLLSLENSEKN